MSSTNMSMSTVTRLGKQIIRSTDIDVCYLGVCLVHVVKHKLAQPDPSFSSSSILASPVHSTKGFRPWNSNSNSNNVLFGTPNV
jgi:hypothetical protein